MLFSSRYRNANNIHAINEQIYKSFVKMHKNTIKKPYQADRKYSFRIYRTHIYNEFSRI